MPQKLRRLRGQYQDVFPYANGVENRNEHVRSNEKKTTTSSAAPMKTLIIGDSILNPINPKGMVKSIQKHSKSGAKVKDVTDEITKYDIKSFSSVVISVGGNGASSSTDIELFEETHDQLISLIKTTHPNCKLYLCYITPRGDVDVTDYIGRLANHWEKYRVSLIKNCDYFFYGNIGLPISRYYTSDGIHLSSSGIRGLLDAIDSTKPIVGDFEHCVYMPRRGNRGNNINQ